MNLRQIVLNGVEIVGLNRWSRFRKRRQLLGLCYHSVIDDDAPANDSRTRLAVGVSQFEAQMAELRRRWQPVSASRIREAVEMGKPLPENAVNVSFDDGYRNNLDLALPILEKYDIPATIFVTTDFIGTEKPIWPLEMGERIVAWPHPTLKIGDVENGLQFELPTDLPRRSALAVELVEQIKNRSLDERNQILEFLRRETGELPSLTPWQRQLYRFLDWDDVRQLAKRNIEIGAHTCSHPNLATLAKSDAASLDHELREPKRIIEKELGVECDMIAYPFGSAESFSDVVLESARQVGYRLGFTLLDRRNATTLDAMQIHRICIHREHTLASFQSLASGIRGN